MPKTIPIALEAHKKLSATTLCGLLKIGPLLSGDYLRFTSLDRDVIANVGDGLGQQTYYANTGMQTSTFSSSSDLSVDNAEAESLEPVFPNTADITIAMIDRGELDDVEFTVYKGNYLDDSMGYEIVANGPLGEQIIQRGGLVRLELRSWSQLLKQNSVVSYYSITCIATFGSQPPGSMIPGPVVPRWSCHYNAEAEWVDFIVTDVGSETVREFSIVAIPSSALDAFDSAEDFYAPGLAEFTSGDNDGQTREIEASSAAPSNGEIDISLQHTTRNPIQIGDEGRIRRDCTHQWSGHNSCQTYNNREWFRGQPFIPIGNGLVLNVPGVAGGHNDADGTGEAT